MLWSGAPARFFAFEVQEFQGRPGAGNEKNRNVKTHGKETFWVTLAGDARLQGITHNYATRVSVTLRSHRFDCLTGRGHFWNRA